MPSSTTSDVLTAVRTALASATGTGTYTYDLSPSAKRILGRPTRGTEPTPPFAMLALGQLTSDHGPQVGRYRRELVVDLMAFAPTANDSTGDRQAAGADLLDDLCQALEADRTLGGLVIDLIVRAGTFDGSAQGLPNTAGVYAEVVVYWHASSAVGV